MAEEVNATLDDVLAVGELNNGRKKKDRPLALSGRPDVLRSSNEDNAKANGVVEDVYEEECVDDDDFLASDEQRAFQMQSE